MEPGIPVDAADFEKIAGLVHKGLKQFLAQRLHRLVEGFDILLLVCLEPVPVVIHADAPEKIDGLRGKAGKHRFTSVFV